MSGSGWWWPLPESPFKKPSVPAVPAAPTTEDKAVQEATAEAARRRQRARGFRSTILGGMVEQGKQTLGS